MRRADESRTTLVGSPSDLVRSSDIVFSTVTSSSALDAASAAAPFLERRHLYADLNSVSPAVKIEIDRVVGASGAAFVEVAVMAPVLPYGHKVPMLIGGAGAGAFAAAMTPFGLRLQHLEGAKVGSAAAVKMCRSIVVKGIEALLFECVMGASRFDADDLVWASLAETFPGIKWKELADYTSGRVVVHGERGRERWKRSRTRCAPSASIRSWPRRRRSGRTGARRWACDRVRPRRSENLSRGARGHQGDRRKFGAIISRKSKVEK